MTGVQTCALPISLRALGRLAREGLRVIFAEGLPTGVSAGDACPHTVLAGCEVASGENILRALDALHVRTAHTTRFEPDLKLYPYEKDGKPLFVMFNEGIREPIDTVLTFPGAENACLYDPYEDCMRAPERTDGGIRVHVEPWQLLIVVIDGNAKSLACATRPVLARAIPVKGFRVSTATATEYPAFTPHPEITMPVNLNRPDGMPRFSGTIRYEGSFEARAGEPLRLSLGEVGETAEVFLNGECVGTRIVAPYDFDLTGLARDGENELTIDVTNTLVYRMHDGFSAYHAIAPSGLIGPVTLLGE